MAVSDRWNALWRRLNANIEDPEAPTETVLGGAPLAMLVVYLMFLTVVTSWMTWTLWDARPNVQAIAADTTTAAPAAATSATATLTVLAPDTIVYGLGRSTVQLRGSGFDASSTVLVDGQQHAGGRFIGPNLMLLALNDADFRQTGTLIITVATGPIRTKPLSLVVSSGAAVSVRWSLWPFTPTTVSVESRLLLLVLMMGMLGGILASFNSLSNYRGEGKLLQSWFLYYQLAPFLGGGIALFLYLVVRAGLLAGTNLELEANSTPWGVLAISALAGLFYDKTLIKLREVFITAFNPRDARTGKFAGSDSASSGFEIGTTSLASATTGVEYHAKLDATGGSSPYSWSVEPELPGGITLDPLTGVVSGTAAAAAMKRSYEFIVSDMNRARARAAIDFEVL